MSDEKASSGTRDSAFDKIAGDRLAYQVSKLVDRRVIDARSPAADALLDYLSIGFGGGPNSVPEWQEQYEARNER